MGYISEIFDGDSPTSRGGCIAQAWSVAEIARAYRLLFFIRLREVPPCAGRPGSY